MSNREGSAGKPKKHRIIDEFKSRRRSSIKAKYSRTQTKIKIDKSNVKKNLKRRNLWIVFSITLALILFISISIYRSLPFQMYRAISDLKNETILIGFQNSAELRPTGGFWGSFALLKIGNSLSESELLFETNPYKNDDILRNETNVPLPKPMAETWQDRPQSFVNANWSFDFPQTAKTLEWYLGHGWQQNVSGVTAISSLSLIDLLKIIGPIDLPDGTKLSSENFSQVMSQKIDTEYWQDPKNVAQNEPKTLVKQLAPRVLEKAKSLPRSKLFFFTLDQLRKGRILFFFNNDSRESIVRKLDLSGEVQSADYDYLQINNANLGAAKTSLDIDQSIAYSVTQDNDRVTANLAIKRSYRDEWPQAEDRNYSRAIVPLGSKLISATLDGQDIMSQVDTMAESGKTTFGFFLTTKPNETKQADLIYELPFNLKNPIDYELVLQKQPGTLPDRLSINVFKTEKFTGPNWTNLKIKGN